MKSIVMAVFRPEAQLTWFVPLPKWPVLCRVGR